MSQQLAGLMGMQGMGMPSMVSSHLFAVKQTKHLVVAGRHGRRGANEQLPALQHVGGMAGRSMPMGGRGMMEVGSLLYLMEASIILDILGQTLASAVEKPSFTWDRTKSSSSP